jgi:uncharacterized protein (DUF1800 family)
MASLDPISGPLGIKAAGHLLRRATFGPTRKMIDQFAAYSIDQAISILFAPVVPPTDAEVPWLVPNPLPSDSIDEPNKSRRFKAWLLERMRSAGASSIEKLTFFMHTQFTAIEGVIEKHTALYNQNKLFRMYALGNIKILARKICNDNAMLVLLDGTLNVNGSPNENFAREFFELFTIGKGAQAGAGDYTNYTEQDVREAARVLSGFAADFTYSYPDSVTGIPTGIVRTSAGGAVAGALAANKHDAGVKIFSPRFDSVQISPNAQSGNMATVDAAQDEVDQLVNMIFAKAETAKNICRKLYRFFVYYKITPEIEINVIEPLANTLIANNYELRPVLEQLLKSQHFFDKDNTQNTDDSRGAIIKSPIELTIGMMIFFNAQENPVIPDNAGPDYIGPYESVLRSLNLQGMDVYNPLDVAGYDAYSQAPYYNRNWISANYLANRYLLPNQLLYANVSMATFFGFYLDALAYANGAGNFTDPSNATLLIQEMIDYLLPEPISAARLGYFRNALLDVFGDTQWLQEWNTYKTTGDDNQVRSQLITFFWTVLKSPEYQLN